MLRTGANYCSWPLLVGGREPWKSSPSPGWRGGALLAALPLLGTFAKLWRRKRGMDDGNWLRNDPALLRRPYFLAHGLCPTQSHPNFPALLVGPKNPRGELVSISQFNPSLELFIPMTLFFIHRFSICFLLLLLLVSQISSFYFLKVIYAHHSEWNRPLKQSSAPSSKKLLSTLLTDYLGFTALCPKSHRCVVFSCLFIRLVPLYCNHIMESKGTALFHLHAPPQSPILPCILFF